MKKLLIAVGFMISGGLLGATGMPVFDATSVATSVQSIVEAFNSAKKQYDQFYSYASMIAETTQGLSESLKDKNASWFDKIYEIAETGQNVYAETLETIDDLGKSIEDLGGEWGMDTSALHEALGAIDNGRKVLRNFTNAANGLTGEDKKSLGFGSMDWDSQTQVAIEGMKQMAAGFESLGNAQKISQMTQELDKAEEDLAATIEKDSMNRAWLQKPTSAYEPLLDETFLNSLWGE